MAQLIPRTTLPGNFAQAASGPARHAAAERFPARHPGGRAEE